jgi:hypothetical protein
MPSPSFRAQVRSRTALLQRRRRLVLDGAEHGRTMMGIGETSSGCIACGNRTAFASPQARRRAVRFRYADQRGNDRNPNGPRPASRGSVARPFRRAIERAPTEGRGPPNSFLSRFFNYARRTAANAGRKVLYEVGGTASGWASSRRCLTGNPRGASRARDDRYEVNLPVVPAGTPSADAEALLADQAGSASPICHWNSVPSRQMACRMTASLRATAIDARFQPMRLARR